MCELSGKIGRVLCLWGPVSGLFITECNGGKAGKTLAKVNWGQAVPDLGHAEDCGISWMVEG